MKLNTAIWIDKYIVGIFNRLLNILVRLTGFFLRPSHKLDRDFKTIAICKFKGMGSIIQSTPLIITLRKNYPDAKIIFITTPGNKRLIELIPQVDEIITLKDNSFFALLFGVPALVAKLIRKRIGLYFDLEIYSNFSSAITAMSCARNRVGFYLRSDQYRLGLYTHMMFYNVNMPIRETYLQMARILPLKEETSELHKLCEETSRLRPEIIPDSIHSKNHIVINCNASDLREERKWPLDRFAGLINYILNNYTFTIYLIGAGNETSHVAELIKRIPENNRIINLAGKTNIDELIALIRHSRMMITNDTGPMHIAYSTSTPTLAFFGPCSPLQYGTFPNSIALYESVYCSPCVHEFLVPPCKGNNVCMQKIDLEKATHAFQQVLSGTLQAQNTNYNAITGRENGYLPGLVKRQKNE